MKLVIFSEAGFEYGFGHFYRMSGICEKALKEYGEAELHLVADEAARENLNRNYVRFTDWHKAENYEAVLNKETTLVVDSYHVDIPELERFKELSRDMIVIDDNIRLDYHDMKVLNPNYFAVSLDYPEDRGNTLYVGGDCTLLREEFDFKGRRAVNDEVRDILITMGGTDLKGLTLEMIRAVRRFSTTAHLHVVCTAAYKDLDAIKDALGKDGNLYVGISAGVMSKLMRDCDFAIATAGQTSNELIKMQCPSILVVVADNQILNTRYLSEEGFVKAIFHGERPGDEDYKTIESMFSADSRRSLTNKLKEFASKRSGKDIICETAFGRKQWEIKS